MSMEVGGWVQVPLGFVFLEKCSIHVSYGFPKQSLDGGWVGAWWVGFELYPSFLWDFLNFLTLQSPLVGQITLVQTAADDGNLQMLGRHLYK